MSRAKNWCGTINNPLPEDEVNLLSLHREHDYLVYQIEQGGEGTPHIQWYIRFQDQQRFNTLKKTLPRAHIELCKGTPADNIKYCTKSEGRLDGPYEFGTRPTVSQGSRNTTEEKALTELVLSGAPILSILEAHPMRFIKYSRGIMTACQLKQKGREALGLAKPVVKVFWGIPGSGKSHKAQTEAKEIGPCHYMVKKGSTYWWDGYTGQPCVIFNDFYGHYPYSELLNLLDKYDNTLGIKGTMCNNVITHIWFTSNRHPSRWYREEVTGPWACANQFVEYPNALERRIEDIQEFTSVYKPTL